MASRKELLASIKPSMNLTKDFLRRIYGYEISFPGFSEQAITAMESAGCSRARQYYENWVAEYEAACKEQIKPIAEWFQKECEREWVKRGEIKRIQKKQIRNKNWTELSQILNFQ